MKDPKNWGTIRRQYTATIEEGQQIGIEVKTVGNRGSGVTVLIPLGMTYKDLKEVLASVRGLIATDFPRTRERYKVKARYYAGRKKADGTTKNGSK